MVVNIRFIAGINGDRVDVKITDNEETVFSETYAYGYTASYNKENARYAEKDYENSIKYGWISIGHCPKPYIGDILTELLAKYNMTKDDAKYSGYYVFPDREATKEEVKKIIERLYAEVE